MFCEVDERGAHPEHSSGFSGSLVLKHAIVEYLVILRPYALSDARECSLENALPPFLLPNLIDLRIWSQERVGKVLGEAYCLFVEGLFERAGDTICPPKM